MSVRVLDTKPFVARETTGERVRRLRLAEDWTQMDLAIRAGVAQHSVSDIELDKSCPTVWLFDRLATALDTCLCYLWAGGAGCEHGREEATA